MIHNNCLNCKRHFTAKRASRKYCSDNCKQMAYFKRNGLVLSGNPLVPAHVKYLPPVPAKESVRYSEPKHERMDNVKYETKPTGKENVKYNLDFNVNNTMLDALIIRLTREMDQKLARSIESVKQELEVKYESRMIKPNLTLDDKLILKQLCNPVPFSRFTNKALQSDKAGLSNPGNQLYVKYVPVEENALNDKTENEEKHFTSIATDMKLNSSPRNTVLHDEEEEEEVNKEQNEESVLNNYEMAELEENQEEQKEQENVNEIKLNKQIEPSPEAIRIRELEMQLLELKFQLENKNTQAPVIEQKNIEPQHNEEPEEEYQWIESKFLNQMKKNYLPDTHYKLKSVLNYWDLDNTMRIMWVNPRLLCLLESLLKLSNYAHIDSHTLFCIVDAFNRLVRSKTYKEMAEDYPYKGLIKELCIKLNQFATTNNSEKVKLQLSLEQKAKLLSIRNEMLKIAGSTMKFSELNFEEVQTASQALRQKSREEKEKKNSNSTFRTDWQSRYRKLKAEELLNAA
jgi:hypothetical protein